MSLQLFQIKVSCRAKERESYKRKKKKREKRLVDSGRRETWRPIGVKRKRVETSGEEEEEASQKLRANGDAVGF